MGDLITLPVAEKSCVDCIWFMEGYRGEYCSSFKEFLALPLHIEAASCDDYELPPEVA